MEAKIYIQFIFQQSQSSTQASALRTASIEVLFSVREVRNA